MRHSRRLMFEADQQINEANVGGALELYNKAWQGWAKVFSRFPTMVTEEVGDDVVKSIGRYKRLLENDLDESFVLHEFLQYRVEKEDPEKYDQAAATLEQFYARARMLLDADSRGETVPVIEKLVSPIEPPQQTKPDAPKADESSSSQPVSSEVKKLDLPIRPPALENPDSQE